MLEYTITVRALIRWNKVVRNFILGGYGRKRPRMLRTIPRPSSLGRHQGFSLQFWDCRLKRRSTTSGDKYPVLGSPATGSGISWGRYVFFVCLEWNGLSLEGGSERRKRKEEIFFFGKFQFWECSSCLRRIRITGNYRLSAYPLNSQRQSHPKRIDCFFYFYFSNLYY